MPWNKRPAPEGNTTQRGLGRAHQKLRALLLPMAYGKPCPYWQIDPQCPGLMERGDALELDHGRPRVLGGRTGDGTGRIAHGPCNRRAGARLGRAIQLGRVPALATAPRPRTSRQW